jgi:hypothetical protein
MLTVVKRSNQTRTAVRMMMVIVKPKKRQSEKCSGVKGRPEIGWVCEEPREKGEGKQLYRQLLI